MRGTLFWAVASLILAGSVRAQGVDRLWVGTGGAGGFDGVYGDPAAWLDGDVLGVPTADDTVIFETSSFVQFTADHAAQRLRNPGGSVVFDLADHTMELAFVDPFFPAAVVGEGVGALEIIHGTLVSGGIHVGSPGQGQLLVEGSGAALLGQELQLGPDGGLGLLEVSGGAAVDVDALRVINGQATLSGGATTLTTIVLTIGALVGEGELILQDGVQVTAMDTHIGANGTGELIASGSGTVFSTHNVYLGSLHSLKHPNDDRVVAGDGARVEVAMYCLVADGTVSVVGAGSLLSVKVGFRLGGDSIPPEAAAISVASGGRIEAGWVEGSLSPPYSPVEVILAPNAYRTQPAIDAGILAAQLSIEVAPLPYTPDPGEYFGLVSADQIDQVDLTLPPLSDERFWRVLTETDGPGQMLAIQVGPTGDADLDGTVGIRDLLQVLADWGPCAEAGCLSDLDVDGEISITDVYMVLDDWD